MTLEEHIAHLNNLAFWREFTFAQNKFSPDPTKELELADNFVWLGDHAYVLQLKEREHPTDNPDTERGWFEKKVLRKATRQIRDSLQFLSEHPRIKITNERGDTFDVATDEIAGITKIVVYLPGSALPERCWRTRYHVSRSAGFIHVLAAHDYLGIIEKLRVPEDIRRYFEYRADVLPKLGASTLVEEPDIMGAFLHDDELPHRDSRELLRTFVQDGDKFDLSPLLSDLHNHINRSHNPHDYYEILREFARVPRSVWREVKLRLLKSLEAMGAKKFVRPYRLSFPATDCTFMIAPLDPDLPANGTEGEQIRVTGLRNLTYAAKYAAKSSKGVGILISGDGEYVQIDWAFLNFPWQSDAQIEQMLNTSNPFREVREMNIDSFLFLPPHENQLKPSE